MNGTIIANPYT